MFLEDGSTFFSSSDLVTRDSADRNLMAWDFSTGVTLSNQIYQVLWVILRKPYMVNVLSFCTSKFLTKWHMQTVDPDQTASEGGSLIRVYTVCNSTK